MAPQFSRRLVGLLRPARWDGQGCQEICCIAIDVQPDPAAAQVARTIREMAESGDITIRATRDTRVVLRPANTLLDGWLWAEQLHRTLVSTGHSDRCLSAGVGLAHARLEHLDEQLLEQARDALDLAKAAAEPQVCTSDMVQVAAAMRQVAALADLGPHQRRQELLRHLARHMGPTQWEHITIHCEHVSKVAMVLAGLMCRVAEQIESIRLAGLCHDIGKCVIPETLLAKPRTLAIEEWHLMARHEDYGHWIAAALGLDLVTRNTIRDHHRRYDSADGQDGAISLGARILCVADALVTMVTDRPYRQARNLTSALKELRRERGRQFDPDVVDQAQGLASLPRIMAA